MSNLPSDVGDLYDVVEHAEIAAEFLGDAANDGDVFVHELAGYLDERCDGTSRRHDVQPWSHSAVPRPPTRRLCTR